MQQHYTHHHITHAHHTGIVIGTVVGSCAVTLLLALASVVGSRSLVTGSLDLSTNLLGNSQTTTDAQPGLAVQADQVVPEASEALGGAAHTANQLQ